LKQGRAGLQLATFGITYIVMRVIKHSFVIRCVCLQHRVIGKLTIWRVCFYMTICQIPGKR